MSLVEIEGSCTSCCHLVCYIYLTPSVLSHTRALIIPTRTLVEMMTIRSSRILAPFLSFFFQIPKLKFTFLLTTFTLTPGSWPVLPFSCFVAAKQLCSSLTSYDLVKLNRVQRQNHFQLCHAWTAGNLEPLPHKKDPPKHTHTLCLIFLQQKKIQNKKPVWKSNQACDITPNSTYPTDFPDILLLSRQFHLDLCQCEKFHRAVA